MSETTGRLPDPIVCDKAVGLGEIGLALTSAARAHRIAAARDLREIGLYPGQEVVLHYLSVNGPSRLCSIVATLGLDASTVTRMIQRLEKGGYIQRESDPLDGRAMRVRLTEEGHGVMEKAKETWRRLEERTIHTLTGAERKELARLLVKLEGNLGPCTEGFGDNGEPL